MFCHVRLRAYLMYCPPRCGMSDIVPLTRYGDRFRLERRLMNRVLSPSAIEQWQPVMTKEVHRLLKQLLDEPEEYVAHIKRYAYP